MEKFSKKLKDKKIKPSNPLIVPAGTEQETGLTRAETEKVTGPVEQPGVSKKAIIKKRE